MYTMENATFSIVSYQFDRVEMDLSNHKNKGLEIGFQVEGLYIKKVWWKEEQQQ